MTTNRTVEGGCNRRVSVDSWHFANCGKPVKAEGLCASHLAGKKRSDASKSAHNEKSKASDDARLRALAIGKSLAVYGIESAPHYSWSTGAHTGRVVVDGEAVLKALKEAAVNG